jgi:hypothetical protein
MSTVVVTEAAPPSVSETDWVTDCALPDDESTTGAGHDPASGEDPGAHRNVIVTGVRYQPLRSASGLDTVAVIVGSVTLGDGDTDAVGEGVGVGVGDVGGGSGWSLPPTCSITVPDATPTSAQPEYDAVTG